MIKNKEAYKSIGEVAQILNLINKKKGTLNTHTIRYWEKEFKQIKPVILSGNRRYYNTSTIKLLKKIQFLLKEQGMTILGVKKLMNINKSLELDEFRNESISIHNSKIKTKLKNILKLLDDLKKIK